MSCNYADGLSPYEDKGILGVPEKFDPPEVLEQKCELLSQWILASNHVLCHTGAGISTSAGIPDFRGPKGVWTLEKKGLKPEISISFDNAEPTVTHMCLKTLMGSGHVKYIITQNIDGLHLKSGIPRDSISELHGDMFVDKCKTCERQFVRKTATTSVGEKYLGYSCPSAKTNGRCCRGKIHDTILDWEASLPVADLDMAEYHSSLADLSICLGTTLQIVPSGTLPLQTKKYGGKLVIINLQPTKFDKKADLIINGYVDDVLLKIMKKLNLEVPKYDPNFDPTKSEKLLGWNISKENLTKHKKLFNENIKSKVKKRKLSKADQKEIAKLINKDGANKFLKKEEIKLESESDKDGEQASEIKTNTNKENGDNVAIKKEEISIKEETISDV